MRAVASAVSAIVELLARRTTITVALRKIGETPGSVERTVLAQRTVARAHVVRDVPLNQPWQKLAVAIGGVGHYRLGIASLPCGEASDHVFRGRRFLTHARRRRLHSDNHATLVVHQIVVVVTEARRSASLG